VSLPPDKTTGQMKFVQPIQKKNIFFLLLFIAACSPLLTTAQQQTPVIDVAKIILSDTINFRSICFQDSLHKVKPADLQGLKFTTAPKAVFRHLTTVQTEKDWWVCFRLKNTADTLINVYFFPGVYASTIDIYEYNDTSKTIAQLPLFMPGITDSIGYRGIHVAPGTEKLYYAHLKFVNTSVNAMDFRIIKDYYLVAFSRTLKIQLNNGNMYTYIISGILLMMIFYSMAVFILNGSIEFMYYACFAFFSGMISF